MPPVVDEAKVTEHVDVPDRPALGTAPLDTKSNDGVGDLKPIVVPPVTVKSDLKLDPDAIDDFSNGEPGIPSYVKNARPWRWAQKMGNVGNPYRDQSRNYQIFDIYTDGGCTIEECVVAGVQIGLNEKLSYLLTVYEVTTHCLAAGLLVMDPDNRKITTCQGAPIPVRVS